MTDNVTAESVFAGNHFRIRQKLFSWISRRFYIEEMSGGATAFASVKDLTLKLDIRLFMDETQKTELLSVKQRSALDWTNDYDVTDSTTGETIGSLRHNGWGSFVIKEWIVMDESVREIGAIKREKKSLLGLFNRQQYLLECGPQEIGRADFRVNSFPPKVTLDLSPVPDDILDRRLAIAFALIVLNTFGK